MVAPLRRDAARRHHARIAGNAKERAGRLAPLLRQVGKGAPAYGSESRALAVLVPGLLARTRASMPTRRARVHDATVPQNHVSSACAHKAWPHIALSEHML